MPFREFRMLAPDQAEHWLRRVHQFRGFWTSRSREVPMYTLGAASYLDAMRSRDGYRQHWEARNPVLRSGFGPLLEEVRARLGEALHAPVEWHSEAALPGFHIFLAHERLVGKGGAIHLDTQFKDVGYELFPEADWSTVISFTLAIALPKAGSGLNYWEGVDAQEWDAASAEQRAELAGEHHRRFLPYRIGTMVMHSGLLVHQIAPAQKFEAWDQRVTLQGHGVRVGDRYLLYW